MKSLFNTEDIIFGKGDSETFLILALFDICHPPSAYFLDKEMQVQHPTSPKYKVQLCLQSFLDRTTPVLSLQGLLRIELHGSV
jgi:hypothetical protein